MQDLNKNYQHVNKEIRTDITKKVIKGSVFVIALALLFKKSKNCEILR